MMKQQFQIRSNSTIRVFLTLVAILFCQLIIPASASPMIFDQSQRARNINCVQFVVEFVDVKLKIVDIIDEYQHIKLEIHKEIDRKTLYLEMYLKKLFWHSMLNGYM